MILNSSYSEGFTTYYETVKQTTCPIVFAQRFTATIGFISRVIFRIHKRGTPEGTLTGKLYATVGSNAGNLLASSVPVSVESISDILSSAGVNMVEFVFNDTVELTASTKYFVGVEVDLTTADNDNYIEFGASTTLFPTHPEQLGIYSGCTSNWTLVPADAVFYVYSKVALPSITTDSVSWTRKQATVTGTFSFSGTYNATYHKATERGIVWSKTSRENPGNQAPGASSYENAVIEIANNNPGAFTKSTGETLNAGIRYYTRAYAKNLTGYAYGDELVFNTLGFPVSTDTTNIIILGITDITNSDSPPATEVTNLPTTPTSVTNSDSPPATEVTNLPTTPTSVTNITI